MTMKFQIEQVALYPQDSDEARRLLRDMGLTEWVSDLVVATGSVGTRKNQTNVAELQFNYDASPTPMRLELEILNYKAGENWMNNRSAPRVSHLGMHVEPGELAKWRRFFSDRGIHVAQEVKTMSHNNPAIAGKRWYHYVIFDTHSILGVDIKFIVRLDRPGKLWAS